MSQYPTNLTDKQWQVTEIILDPQHRKRKYSLRDNMDAIMYIVKTECQWNKKFKFMIKEDKKMIVTYWMNLAIYLLNFIFLAQVVIGEQ